MHDGERIGYMNAAIDLFRAGAKKEGAWLIVQTEMTLGDYISRMDTRHGEIAELALIFDYIEKLNQREARKAAKLSQSDSVKLLPAPGMNVPHVSRAAILEMD